MSVNFMGDFDFSKISNYAVGGAVKPSPDQYVGELLVNAGKYTFNFCERDTIDYSKTDYKFLSNNTYHEKNILVVLESPHRFEYDENNNPIGLAMGKTGDNLFELFTFALNKSILKINDGEYNVILTNAIQYQTSCGLNPIDRRLRDKNWLDIYDNYGGEEDFKKRIYLIKPRVTLNLCTGGRDSEGLRTKVSNSLIKFGLKKNRHFAEGNHPASWNFHGDTKNAHIY